MVFSGWVKKIRDVPFSFQQAIELGATRYELHKMLSDGSLERVARGVYRLTKNDIVDEDLFRAASLRVGDPSAICLISALTYYGITDQIPHQIWMMVPANKVSFHADLRLVRTRVPQWDIGIVKHKGFCVTSIERTIVDALTHRRQIGSQIAFDALKTALRTRKTKLNQVYDMATKLGVAHRIRSFIEVLA